MRDKHIILTLGRSGSNTFVDMLNQNPAILNFGEVLGEWTQLRRMQRRVGLLVNDDKAYLDAVLENGKFHYTANMVRSLGKIRSRRWHEIKRIPAVKTVGMKDFSTNFQRYGLGDYISKSLDVKVIGLTRENVLERMVSNAFLQETGVVASTSREASTASKTLRIDPNTVVDELKVIEGENNALKVMLDDLSPDRVLRIDYTDLYTNEAYTVEVVRRAYAFLGVSDIVPEVRMRKIIKRNPLDALENGAEIREVIKASRFSVYLPD